MKEEGKEGKEEGGEYEYANRQQCQKLTSTCTLE